MLDAFFRAASPEAARITFSSFFDIHHGALAACFLHCMRHSAHAKRAFPNSLPRLGSEAPRDLQDSLCGIACTPAWELTFVLFHGCSIKMGSGSALPINRWKNHFEKLNSYLLALGILTLSTKR